MIFFDLDNTLLDHDGAERDAIRSFFASYRNSIIPYPDTPEQLWREITDKHRARWRSGELNFEEQRRARISELFERPLTVAEADQLFAEYYDIYRRHWRLFSDVEPALKQLHTLSPLAVITNGFNSQQTAKLRETGILDYFSLVMTSEQAGVAKPDPRIFQAAINSAKESPEDCWYIGNHPENDALAAQQVGMKAVWLNRYGSDTRSEIRPGTRVVRSLTGFADLVKTTMCI
ncbi:2-haloalkanoic acid dehalogenase [Photobacterium marinum]|uniref:2-haloalkanoic acid dehalogenase n=1 Tax=Photobacterium marinum TaxID=1056511 RepID=L8J8W1_9GAMM|nr:HAD family hydrolase [Photobacterium marinum]ELR65226.1 2-haloalkanoic acid dehalogenase [Photobacterium marinum]